MTTIGSYPEISQDSLWVLVAQKKVLVVDANGTESFSEGHIPGAVDYEAISPHWPEGLPKDPHSLIVAYCGGPRCMAWKTAAEALTRLGFLNVKHYAGGISEWEESNMPMERSFGSISPIEDASAQSELAAIPRCKLSPTAQAARIEAIRSDIFSKIRTQAEADGALLLDFEDNPENASALTEFIRFERECCDSLRFSMIRKANPDAIRLEIKGPQEILTAFKQATRNR